MPQARLPDINTAFNFHRGKAEMHWQAKNYTAAVGSLYAFNSLLPKEYRMIISNSQYYDKVRQDRLCVCNHCKVETKYQSINIREVPLYDIAEILSGTKYERIWECPQCNKNNKLLNTKMIQEVLQVPFYIKMVPEPPQRKDGLMNRRSFDKKFALWFWQLLNELESSAAKFRDDNWQKEDRIGSDSDIDTSDEIEEAIIS